jgi:matrixin
MRSRWIACCAVSCAGWLVCGSASAFVLTGQNWRYQTHPMGEDWRVCATGMPGSGGLIVINSGVQRTKDGAAAWDYAHFTFPFGTDACLSGGVYPTYNNVNQVDFGGGLGANVLAETTVFFVPSTRDIIECDMRFNNAVTWYVGIGTPPPTQFDWWSVAAHEMGHCLGLSHEDAPLTPTPVMASTLAKGEVRRALTADDRAGRNAIYGIGGGSDVDRDGTADLVVWRPSDGGWYVLTSSSNFTAPFFRQWGLSGDIPVGGSDVDRDGITDLVVWRPSDGGWYVLTSSSNFTAPFFRQWGLSSDIPVGGSDVDRDGTADLVVWRPSDGVWYVLTSSSNFTAPFFRQWGLSGDIPVGGSDVDGDGTADLVVWRPSDGVWYVLTSSSNFTAHFFRQWGLSGDIPVGGSGDIDHVTGSLEAGLTLSAQ